MRHFLLFAFVFLMASCTTTVKRLELQSFEYGDSKFSTQYQQVEETVPKAPTNADGATREISSGTLGDDFQLFPQLTIIQQLAPKSARLTVSRNFLETCGQSLVLDGKTTLLSNPVFEISSATLSPNGKTIAFSCREKPNSPWTIWLIDANGDAPRMLGKGRDPDWLSDATLVFAATRNKSGVLLTRSTVGAREAMLFTSPSTLRHVSVDRNTGHIAYVTTSAADGRDGEIWFYTPTSKQTIRISNHPARDDAPVWSADGKQIYFRSTRDGEWAIWSQIVPEPTSPNSTRGVSAK